MWYIVVVFFASGVTNTPAHFEQGWYPRPVDGGLGICRAVGQQIFNFLGAQDKTLRGEAWEISCINADNMEELTDLINIRWTFEPAPASFVPEMPA